MDMLACKVIVTLLHVFALASSLVRIMQRWRTKLLGWDDYAAGFAASLDTVVLILFWLQYKAGNIPLDQDNGTGDVSFIFSWWTFSFLTSTVIWVARISISLSLVRIYLPGHPHRRAAIALAGFLFLLYAVCVLLPTFSCRGEPWWNLVIEDCRGLSPPRISAVLFSFDFGSDLFLLIGPLHALWRIKFPRTERALLLSLFSSSVLTLLATLSYCAVYYVVSKSDPDAGLIVMFMSHIQTSVSLIAANLLVVGMITFRAVRRRYGPFPSASPPVRARTPPPSVLQMPTDSEKIQTTTPPPVFTILSDRAYIFEPLSHNYDDTSASSPEITWPGKVLIQPDRDAVSLP